MGKKKKKKQKNKVVPTFGRLLGRKAGGELEFEWVREEIAIAKLMDPLITTIVPDESASIDDHEAVSAFLASIWEWLTTNEEEYKQKLEEVILETDQDEATPFYMSKLLPALQELYTEMFPEGNNKEAGKIKRRLAADDLVFETFIGSVREELLTDDLMDLLEIN